MQPFTWESSDAHSIVNSGNIQLNRRLAHGVSGSASYTLMKSMDDSPSLGGGNAVAQDPQNLGAEYALSNFDRAQQFTGNLYWEIPVGANRRWLRNGGFFGNVLGDWAASFTFTAQTGTPLTARVLGSASNIAQGVSGATRANVTGQPIALSSPTVAANGVPLFFNTGAFTAPPSGDIFGAAGRNSFFGPGSHQLNATFVRDIRLGGNRALTLNINALNLLNPVQWATVDTNVNSLTYGQVLSVRPMRSFTINARFRF